MNFETIYHTFPSVAKLIGGKAKATVEAQTKADIAHHEHRVRELESRGKLSLSEKALLMQSKAILLKPQLGYNSCQCTPKCK